MKQLLVMIAAGVLLGCEESKEEKAAKAKAAGDAKAVEAFIRDVAEAKAAVEAQAAAAETKEQSAIVEKAIRGSLEKLEGELTEADLAKVTKLNLALTQITTAGLKDIAKLRQLTSLSLHYTKITDTDLKEVSTLQQLTHLGLGGTQITDAGLKEVVKLQQLRSLILIGTQITAAGRAEFLKELPKCRIIGR